MMRALYTFGILLYGLGLRIASIFNHKASLWVSGRKNLFANLEKSIGKNGNPVIWIHCASLGEFEQGRPLIEKIKSEHPLYLILLTFFSPSGYEVRKNYAGADFVFYMPLDTPSNAKRFLEVVNPVMAVFVKYEFWLNHLNALTGKKIPHYLISGIFRDNQIFFKSHGSIFREALLNYTHIFTQEEHSRNLIGKIGVSHVTVAGDTRFDRVAEIAAGAKDITIAAAFARNIDKIIVAGSTWGADENVLFPSMKKHFSSGWKLIIAPHEVSEDRLISIETMLTENNVAPDKIVRYSKASESIAATAQVLIIDNIGMLSSLYRYGNVAYIGGGFGKSIHNTLEAAVYGIPVVFGPAYEKFNEAIGLIGCKGGFGVHTPEELQKTLDDLLGNENHRIVTGRNAGNFVKENLGATDKILSVIKF